MANLPFKYPLDLTGSSPENKVINEQHTIGMMRGRIFVPKGGPFFGNSTVIRDVENDRVLQPRVDYYLVHYHEEASERTNQPVYAAVRIVNRDVSTQVAITTQYVGGEFGYVYSAIVDAIRTLEIDGRPVNWGDLVGVPSEFNPTPHLHDIRNSFNWNSVVDALDRIRVAVLEGDIGSHKLIIDTVNAQFNVFDLFRLQMIQDLAQHRSDTNSAIQALDTKVVDVYIATLRSNLRRYLESTPWKTSSLTVGPNMKYMFYPPSVNTVNWNVTVTIPSNATPEDGATIELFAVRDGCTLTINAGNGPVRRVINNQETLQLDDKTTITNVVVGQAGVKLVWDTRNSTWNLVEQVDPKKARFDTYTLKEITTTGPLDLSQGNCFILSAGSSRNVSFTNIPMNRSFSVTLTVLGGGLVMWPSIAWTNGVTPVLSTNKTIVTLYRTANTWVGSWQAIPA